MDEQYNSLPRQPEGHRDDDATERPTVPGDASIPRHLFTLTVEDVAVMLADHHVPRDQRTIQRWCKSGKLKAIIDHEAGDRYLIEPSSTRAWVATLVAEKRRQDEAFAALSRQQSRQDRAVPDNAAADTVRANSCNADSLDDFGQTRRDAEASDEEGRDSDAALKAKVAKLEEELISLRIDKQARDQVISMIREEYTKAIEHALDRSERVGALEAENRHLRELLPPGQEAEAQPPRINFAPQSAYGQDWSAGDNPRSDDSRGV